MKKRIEGATKLLIIGFLMILSQPLLDSYEKKLQVSVDYAHVYLKADENSPVVETLVRGSVLSLLYSGKMKKNWYYVCFKSEKTQATKSGYILDSMVELLYDPLKTVTIKEEQAKPEVEYAPRKFEEMSWGLSKKEVVELEGRPISLEQAPNFDIMRYQQKVINLDCVIEYYFYSNKLAKTTFTFFNNYPDKNSYLENYQRIKDALTQKFGRPHEENLYWRDSQYKDDFSAWGEAISRGHLELNSRWLTAKTEIRANLTGANEEIFLTVGYTSLDSKNWARKGD